MRIAYYAMCAYLLTSCSPQTPPGKTKYHRPTVKVVEVFHETVGRVETYASPSISSPVLGLAGPLAQSHFPTFSKSFPSPPADLQNKLLGRKRGGQDRYIAFYLPISIKEAVLQQKAHNRLHAEIYSSKNGPVYFTKKIEIGKDNPFNSNLFPLFAGLPDEKVPFNNSELVYLKISLGKKVKLLVPEKSIHSSFFGHYLYVLTKNGNYERRRVKLGDPEDGLIVVLSGIEQDDKIAL